MTQPETGGANKETLPDFIIIGAQKCGTMTLRHNLAQHSGVYMAQKEEWPVEEMHFFNNQEHWERGESWYRSHFSHPELLQGEKTPDYLDNFTVHQRMHATVPEARLIMLLRNPVDRAYSAWNHYNQDIEITSSWGWEVIGFEQALERGMRYPQEIFVQLFVKGLYGPQIDHLLQFYPREQIHIVITERMHRAPEKEYQKVLAFLGLEAEEGVFKNHHMRGYTRPMHHETRTRLGRLFQPYNELLFKIVGERIQEWEGG